jgi:hypothetical protein
VFLTGGREQQRIDHYRTTDAECRSRQLNVRKSIDLLSPQELSDFRRAVKQALALNDKRGL